MDIVISEYASSTEDPCSVVDDRFLFNTKDIVVDGNCKFVISPDNLTATLVEMVTSEKTIYIPSNVTYQNRSYPVVSIDFYFNNSPKFFSGFVWKGSPEDSIENIYIPASVTSINHFPFGKRNFFEGSKFPKGIEDYYDYKQTCYLNCKYYEVIDNFECIVHNDNTISILSYLGNDRFIIIPSTLLINDNHYAVTRIESNANIGAAEYDKWIYIPDSISYIGTNAISGGSKVFFGQDEVPESYEKIYDSTHVYNSVSRFYNDGTYLYSISNNGNAYIEEYYGTDMDIIVPNNVEIDGVSYPIVEIHMSAFYLTSEIRSITIREGIRKIEYHAFYFECNSKYVFIPSTVNTIESEAFCFFGRIEKPTFICSVDCKPAGWADDFEGPGWTTCEYGLEYNVKQLVAFGDYIYLYCENNKAIFFKYSGTGSDLIIHSRVLDDDGVEYDVVEIWSKAIYKIEFVKLVIPNSVIKIKADSIYAGAYAYGQTINIYIPTSVLYVGDNAFTCFNNRSMVLNCYADTKPEGWSDSFYSKEGGSIKVVWGYSAA